eukprot:gene503-957_t
MTTKIIVDFVSANVIETLQHEVVNRMQATTEADDTSFDLNDENSPLIKNTTDLQDYNTNGQKLRHSSHDKWYIGLTYMSCMCICGLVIVALGSTIDEIAGNIGYKSVEIGSVFISRGFGAIFGTILSAKLYKWMNGNNVMTFALVDIGILLCSLPWCKSALVLHLSFFFLGLATAITYTGCQIMTRKVHGKSAGSWLNANTVVFGISGVIVPLIQLLFNTQQEQYLVISIFITFVCILLLFCPDPETFQMPFNNLLNIAKSVQTPPVVIHYWVETAVASMMFCLIGGNIALTSYITAYIKETKILPGKASPDALLVLWLAIAIGRLVGEYDQHSLSNKSLLLHCTLLLIGGCCALLLIVTYPLNTQSLWLGLICYGLCNGPCIGYCYDLNSRTTFPSEKSLSIVMFGINAGASFIPFLTALVWDNGFGSQALIYIAIVSMSIPLPLLHVVKYISYEPSVNPRFAPI